MHDGKNSLALRSGRISIIYLFAEKKFRGILYFYFLKVTAKLKCLQVLTNLFFSF